jgi:hypothetical protein
VAAYAVDRRDPPCPDGDSAAEWRRDRDSRLEFTSAGRIVWRVQGRNARLLTMGFDPYTACGIVGAGCFVAAYFATLQGWMSAQDWRFPATNLLGASLVLVSLTDAWNLPSVVLECFWGAISLYGLVRSLRG